MSLRLKTYPPVAADIPRRDVMAAWRSSQPVESCLREIGEYLGTRHLFPVNSGRTALCLILKAALEPGSKVILPGYTCFTVPAAVIKAGMIPIISDSDPADLGYDLDALRGTLQNHPDTRAVVVCHLFGIPLDIDAIRELAGPDIFVIDDAAQALGIQIDNRWLGTCGDAGFYSFGRGKSLSLAGGGLLVTDHDNLGDKTKATLNKEISTGKGSFGNVPKLLLYNSLTSPAIFNILTRMPGIELGRSEFRPDFTVGLMPDLKIRLLSRIIRTAEKLNAARGAIADDYAARFEDMGGISIPRSRIDNKPGSLRFPVLVHDPSRRARILERARRRGLGLSAMYPTALDAVPALRRSASGDLKGARNIAETIVTLPTHRYIRSADNDNGVIETIIGLF